MYKIYKCISCKRKNKTMKPLIKYRGGKSKEIPQIIKHIPKFNGNYIEPFFGGGALYFYLEPTKAIINDLNSKLMSFYKEIQTNFDEIQKELKEIECLYSVNQLNFLELKSKTPELRVKNENEALYYEMRCMFNELIDKKYSDSVLYFFINKTAYSGMIRYNSKGEFNVPFGRYPNLNTSLVTEAHSKLLSTAKIKNLDYIDIFTMADKDDFMFLDPPYDCIFSDYGNVEYKDGFNEKSHIELSENYKKLKCKALMVIGRTPLTEELYGNMIIDEYGKSYSVNIRNRFKSTASHILVSNYTEALNINNFQKKIKSELIF